MSGHQRSKYQHIASVNTLVGINAGQYGAIGHTSLFGRDACYNAGNLSDVSSYGWQSGYMAINGKYSTHIGTQAGKHRRQEHSTCVGLCRHSQASKHNKNSS